MGRWLDPYMALGRPRRPRRNSLTMSIAGDKSSLETCNLQPPIGTSTKQTQLVWLQPLTHGKIPNTDDNYTCVTLTQVSASGSASAAGTVLLNIQVYSCSKLVVRGCTLYLFRGIIHYTMMMEEHTYTYTYW